MKSTRACQSCGRPFEAEAWQRLCWDCWREQRRNRQRDAAYDRGWHDGYVAANSANALRAAPQLDPQLIEQAVRLCHPDWHPSERYELANSTTAALLALRTELAA